MTKTTIADDYFEWMYNLVCGDKFAKRNSYRKLLSYLHEIEFYYIIPRDVNRAQDGVDLRYRFAYDILDNPKEELGGRCSVFEMMVGLAIRCESFMDDTEYGDRTGQWFWGMINSLGLGHMIDSKFDKDEVDYVIDRFLRREYEPDGKGGLFTVRHCDDDLRDLEIWIQLCYYLDSIV